MSYSWSNNYFQSLEDGFGSVDGRPLLKELNFLARGNISTVPLISSASATRRREDAICIDWWHGWKSRRYILAVCKYMNIHSVRRTRRIKNRRWKRCVCGGVGVGVGGVFLHSCVILCRSECTRHPVQCLSVSRFTQLFDKRAQQKCHVRPARLI